MPRHLLTGEELSHDEVVGIVDRAIELKADPLSSQALAGKAVALETVDFNDPNRPKTCLEVDFPILPVNQVAIIEGNAGKPIYQMSKWWARRRSRTGAT